MNIAQINPASFKIDKIQKINACNGCTLQEVDELKSIEDPAPVDVTTLVSDLTPYKSSIDYKFNACFKSKKD